MLHHCSGGSFRPDLDHGNRVRIQVHGEVLRVIQRSTHRGNRIRMLEGRGILQPGADRVQLRDGLLGNAGALESHEQGVPLRSIVDGLDHDPAAVGARRSDGIDRTGQPVFRLHGRDLVEEALAVGNVPEGAARGGKVPFRVVLAKELLDRVGRPREPGDVVVVDERRPGGIVRRVSHEQGRAAHRQAGAELLVEHQAAGRMEPGPPIVGA